MDEFVLRRELLSPGGPRQSRVDHDDPPATFLVSRPSARTLQRCASSPLFCRHNSPYTTMPAEARQIQASVLHGAKDLRVVSRLQPVHTDVHTDILSQETRTLEAPASTELQVAVRATGLCGSDLHYYQHYRNGDIICREPMSLGHESAGVVVAVGSAVSNFKIGDKVALEVGLPCGHCERCAEGRYNICKSMKFRSSAKAFPHAQGTLQDRINHPAAWCHK